MLGTRGLFAPEARGLTNLVGEELRKQIDDFYPVDQATEAASSPQDEQIVLGQKPGVVVKVDREGQSPFASTPSP